MAKHLLYIFLLSATIISCSNSLQKRKAAAEKIVETVETFKKQNWRFPNKLNEVGMRESESDLAFYHKINEQEYEVWYGLDLGDSKTYNSKTCKWQ